VVCLVGRVTWYTSEDIIGGYVEEEDLACEGGRSEELGSFDIEGAGGGWVGVDEVGRTIGGAVDYNGGSVTVISDQVCSECEEAATDHLLDLVQSFLNL